MNKRFVALTAAVLMAVMSFGSAFATGETADKITTEVAVESTKADDTVKETTAAETETTEEKKERQATEKAVQIAASTEEAKETEATTAQMTETEKTTVQPDLTMGEEKEKSKNKASSKSDFWFDSSTGTITGYLNSTATTVDIPSTIDGVKVTKIGDRAFMKMNL